MTPSGHLAAIGLFVGDIRGGLGPFLGLAGPGAAAYVPAPRLADTREIGRPYPARVAG